MMLYAQPASRLVLLTTDDIIRADDGQVLVRLGDPPTPVPDPFAELLLHVRDKNTGGTSRAAWLFPGRAGRPLHSRTLADQVRNLGIPGSSGRVAALRQLVLQVPAPVIARALGFHDKTTTRAAARAGGSWNRYAPSDHAR